MKRRGFLGTLLAFGAMPVLAKLDFPAPVIQQALAVPKDFIAHEVPGFGFLSELSFEGRFPEIDEEFSVSTMSLWRKGSDSLLFTQSCAPGGFLVWRALPGLELCFTKEQPIIACVSPGAQLMMHWRGENGRRAVRRIDDLGGITTHYLN
jgi:hypothetical protein